MIDTLVVSTNPQYTFTVFKDLDLEAVFTLEIVKHNITLTRNNESGGTVTGGGIYLQGDLASILATPANGYSFSGWMVDTLLVSGNPQYVFTVDRDLELKAVFTLTTDMVEKLEYSFAAYPNPASDRLFLNSAGKTLSKIQLIDLTGAEVYADSEIPSCEGIDLNGLKNGLYLLRVYTTHDVFTIKLTIDKN